MNPGEKAQMWLRVDRPNRAPSSFDNMDDRPVRTANWTAAEIVAKVPDDALTINFGVMAIPGGRAWVDGMTFEVLPQGSTDMPTGLNFSAAPVNLDFRKGTAGNVPSGWSAIQRDGFSAELRMDGCRTANPCAVVIGAAATKQIQFGNLMQAFDAKDFRGKTVRLRAWLKLDTAEPADRAQMWMRVDDLKGNQRPSFFDNMDDRPVTAAEWKLAEIVGKVGNDAQTVNVGVMSIGKGRAWVDSVAFDVVPDGTALTRLASAGSSPANLDFSQGSVGGVPTGWVANRTKGYSAELRKQGCLGAACAVVLGSPTPEPGTFGNLMQSFSAAAYRGKTVRLRAKLRLNATDAGDTAQLWLRVDLPGRKTGFFDNMSDRPVTSAAWTDVEIIGKIDPDAEMIYFGVMSIGKGQAWIDGISFDVVP